MPNEFGETYDGTIYRAVGNWLGERYFEYGFARGTAQEVGFLAELLGLSARSRVLDVGWAIADEGLPGEFHVLDARFMEFESTADQAAICLCEGAFGLGLAGSDAAHQQILDNVFRALRSGGHFVLSAIQTSNAVRDPAVAEALDAYTGTMWEDEVIVDLEGQERQVAIYTTTFSFRELKLLLERSGFEVIAGYGCNVGNFARKPLTVDDIEIMMVARKP
ncbi:MAG: hypothetical protein M0Z36_05180 [Thermaerobacter sp.]|nr:hypothetical protein [Thermaerobacter sp.]